jgi:putative hydrolase of the HAD superfamily
MGFQLSRAVLLDALGTLVVLEPPAPLLRAQLAARYAVEVSLESATAAIAAEIAYYRAHLQEGGDADSLSELRLRCAQALRDALPTEAQARLPDSRRLVAALLASLRFDPFPDALTALPKLRARGVRVVVVSNWDVSLHEVLARVGLAASVDAIVTSAGTGTRKPEPAIFTRALELAGAAAEQAIHVGDSPDEDVAGARAAGIEPVLIRRSGAAAAAGTVTALTGVRTIASLEELLEADA